MTMHAPRLSVVIPMRNEAPALETLFARLLPVLNATRLTYELVCIDDGSRDDTLAQLLQRRHALPTLRVVELTRNFGKEAALTAGLAHSRGDAVIVIDADLQDPPELIPQMIDAWQQGHEVVAAVHRLRDRDRWLKRASAGLFYGLMRRISDVQLMPNAGDFRLLDRVAVDALLRLPERTRFNKGLFAWIGFKTAYIEHVRAPRSDGVSQFNFRRLTRLAIDGITSFSALPLQLWVYLGLTIAGMAFLYGSAIIVRTLIWGVVVPGYASLIVAVMFFGGINLLGIGILGEYIGRIFIEVKARPLYLVRRVHGAADDDSAPRT